MNARYTHPRGSLAMLVTPVTSLSGEMTGNITGETKQTVMRKKRMTPVIRYDTCHTQ